MFPPRGHTSCAVAYDCNNEPLPEVGRGVDSFQERFPVGEDEDGDCNPEVVPQISLTSQFLSARR